MARTSPPDFLGSQVQDQLVGLGLNFVCGAQFELIGACFLSFDVTFQQAEDFFSQPCQILRDRFQLFASRRARNALQDASVDPVDLRPIGRPLPCPAGRNALLDPRRDHFGDVAPAQRDPLTHKS